MSCSPWYAGELRGGVGTQHALNSGLRTDCFVLGEPTELDIAFSHTASIVLFIHVLGRTKHFATVDTPGMKGVNAVEKAAAVIAALGRSHAPIAAPEHGGWLRHKPAAGFEGLPQNQYRADSRRPRTRPTIRRARPCSRIAAR